MSNQVSASTLYTFLESQLDHNFEKNVFKTYTQLNPTLYIPKRTSPIGLIYASIKIARSLNVPRSTLIELLMGTSVYNFGPISPEDLFSVSVGKYDKRFKTISLHSHDSMSLAMHFARDNVVNYHNYELRESNDDHHLLHYYEYCCGTDRCEVTCPDGRICHSIARASRTVSGTIEFNEHELEVLRYYSDTYGIFHGGDQWLNITKEYDNNQSWSYNERKYLGI